MSKRIFVVRHGEYDIRGNQSLTPDGQIQAKQAGAKLAEAGLINATVLSSSAKRAMETADIITKEVKGKGPFVSADLMNQAMIPFLIPSFDDFLDKILNDHGQKNNSDDLVVVSHAELINAIQYVAESLGEMAFCETVEYIPGSWVPPKL